MNEATASTDQPTAHALDRRAMLRRLAATTAVAWAAPEVLATSRASAMALSGCYTDYDFDDGTLQGWTANNWRAAGWQVSSTHSFAGGYSAWFGHASAFNSLYPVRGEPSYRQGRRAQRGTLISPATTVAATDVVAFHIRLAIESSPSHDRFHLYIVQGSTRVQLWDKSQGGFAVIDHPEGASTNWDLFTTQGSWASIEVTIGTPAGIVLDDPVQFEFDFQTVDGLYNRTEGIYLDNIMLPCSGAATGAQGGSATLDSGFPPGYQPPPAAPIPEERGNPRRA